MSNRACLNFENWQKCARMRSVKSGMKVTEASTPTWKHSLKQTLKEVVVKKHQLTLRPSVNSVQGIYNRQKILPKTCTSKTHNLFMYTQATIDPFVIILLAICFYFVSNQQRQHNIIHTLNHKRNTPLIQKSSV